MTQPEIVLWSKIRNRQLNGLKFRRQYSVGNFILDFYCPSARVAIELDGDSHFSNLGKRKDKLRDQFLRNLDIKVLRFTNEEVMKNLGGVLEEIGTATVSTSSDSSCTRRRTHGIK